MKIKVIVQTKSKKPRIEKNINQRLKIYVSQPPIEGKANQAVVKSLAKFYDVSKSRVRLISGAKSKYKLYEVIRKKTEYEKRR